MKSGFSKIAERWSSVLEASASGERIHPDDQEISGMLLSSPNQYRFLVSMLNDTDALAAFVQVRCHCRVACIAMA